KQPAWPPASTESRCAKISYALRSVAVAKTCTLRIRCRLRFFFMFPWPPALNRIIRSRAEINIDVVDVAHDVFVIAERRHDLGFAAAEILFTTNNNPIKFRVVDSFH